MEPLVIIAIVVLFSMLDAVARKQRQARPPSGEETAPPDLSAPQPTSDGPYSYDDDVVPEVQPQRPRPTSSEELLPADLWEEIRRLAQGRAPTQSVPAPRPRRPAQPPRPPKQRPPAKSASAEHPVHRAHAKMGRPLAERRTPLDRPEEGPRPSADVLAVREMLTGGGRSALRRAIVLEEVLGPPAAMRGDPYEPGG